MSIQLLDQIENIVTFHARAYECKIQAPEEIEWNIKEIKVLDAEIKEKEKRRNRLLNDVKLYMKDNETLYNWHGEELATWKYSKPAVKFNVKSFQQEHPRMYKNYMIESEPVRRFLIKD